MMRKFFTKRVILELILLLFLLIFLIYNLKKYNSAPDTPNAAYGYYRLAKSLTDEGKYQEAEDAVKKSFAIDSTFYKAFIELGCIYILTGDYIKAEEPFMTALKYVGDDKRNREIIYYNLGLVYAREKNVREAWKYFIRAYRMRPRLEMPGYWSDKAIDYVTKNDKKGFTKYVENISPSEVYRRRSSIWRYFHKRGYRKVIDESNRYLTDNPNSIYANLFIVVQVPAMTAIGEYDEAERKLQILENSGADEKEVVWVRDVLANIFYRQKRYTQALKHFNEIRKRYPNYKEINRVLFLSAGIYEIKGNLSKALAAYQELVDRYPENPNAPQVYIQRGRIYERLGNYAKAYQEYLKSKMLMPFFISNLIVFCIVSGLFVGGVVLMSRLFFRKKLIQLKDSNIFRKFDLFIFIFLLFSVPTVVYAHWILPLNHYFTHFFKSLHINPAVLSSILSQLILFSICLIYLKKRYKLDNASLGFFSRGYKFNIILPLVVTIGSVIICFSILTFIFRFIAKPFPSPWKDVTDNIITKGNPGEIYFLFVALVLISPIIEEITFRVFLLNFLKKYSNIAIAVILSSFIFALIHYSIVRIPYFFILGVILSTLYIKTKTIIPSMVTHALYNAFVFFIWVSFFYKF